MAEKSFVHLHVHSHYSLLDGLGKIDQLVNKAVAQGMPALATTDHGVMHSAIEFYQSCKKAGIKPIVGVEAYVAPRARTDKTGGLDSKPFHLLLLAQNFEGYKNLIKLTSAAHLEGYYYKPRIDRDLLSRYNQGIIATSACLASETSRLILNKDEDKLKETISLYKEMFPGRYFLELQHHASIPEQQVVNQRLIALADELKLPLVATNDVHYVNSDDHNTHDVLVCIQTGKLVADTNRMLYTGDFSLKSAEQMWEHFAHVPQALENTLKVADMVNLEIPLGNNILPNFPLPEGETEASYLRRLSEEGLAKRYSNVTPEIKARLEYELETIEKTGFPGYLLIVADMISFARSRGIVVGPGRGSAAGSLICYLTGITNIDPMHYGLLFERFLDMNRISMPDIDMDYEDERRGEVINYLREKYGENHVAGIITFGTIMARAAVRDVGRVLGVPYQDVDRIAKVIPPPVQGRHIPLAKSIEDAPELREIYQSDATAKQVIDTAIRLEGTVRHASQHACAIVISKEPLDQYVPVQAAQGGDIHQVTQYSMGPIESIGLLKMDLLGLSNLTILRRAKEIIEAVHGINVDLDKVKTDDLKTYHLLGRGETVGVFQLESSGMQRYIRDLKPDKIEDIIAMVSLYRPGPMQWIESFVKRKNGKEAVKYMHKLAENAFKETYGIPVYQEQVMQLSKDMAGFTGPEADTLRKAIGKKIPKLMAQMKEKFVDGSIKNGVDKKQAEAIFKQLEDFAAYCFNKSHAACYALIAYHTAYLKAHYPECFMAALMTSDLDNIDRISIEIAECERLKLKVMPPDVNQSYADFAVVKDEAAIRFGLGAIKNVGHAVAESIVTERKKGGEFESLEDFLTRLSDTLNKKVLDSLVRSGALDRFGPRQSLWAGLELLGKYVQESSQAKKDQLSIFGGEGQSTLVKINLPAGIEDKAGFLNWEKELLGLYLSDHPLKTHQDKLTKLATPINQLNTQIPVARVVGIITTLKKITTKNGQPMAFAQLEDLTGTIEAVVFPGSYEANKDAFLPDKIIGVDGKINDKDGSLKVLVDKVWTLDELLGGQLPPPKLNDFGGNGNGGGGWGGNNGNGGRRWQPKEESAPVAASNFVIDLPSRVSKDYLARMKTVLESHPGPIPVILQVTNEDSTKVISTKTTVTPSPQLQEEIRHLDTVGVKN